MFAKTLVIPATANGLALRVGVVADSFYVVSCSENLNVQVFRGSTMLDNISNFPCANLGQDYAEGGGFTRLEIQTNSGNAGSITLLCGDAKTTYAALSGTVNVIDNSSPKYAAVSGMGFTAPLNIAPVAAQYCQFQLRNPAASGKNLIYLLGDFTAYNGAANIGLRLEKLQSAVDLANAIAASNRSLGGAAPAAVVTSTSAAAALGNPVIAYELVPVGSMGEVRRPVTPIIVPPGWILQFELTGQDQGVTGAIYWEEWAVGSL